MSVRRAFPYASLTSGHPAGLLAERTNDPRQRLGRRGERAAETLLRRAGMTVVARRYRRPFGEIDLVARQGRLIVFVEVKTRSGEAYGRPAEAVGGTKQRRMARVALDYLRRYGLLERPCRFDVVEVISHPGEPLRTRHIRDAFRLRQGR